VYVPLLHDGITCVCAREGSAGPADIDSCIRYRALLWIYRALLWIYRALLRVCRARV